MEKSEENWKATQRNGRKLSNTPKHVAKFAGAMQDHQRRLNSSYRHVAKFYDAKSQKRIVRPPKKVKQYSQAASKVCRSKQGNPRS